jgi:Flp pilus assembly protein CpaB
MKPKNLILIGVAVVCGLAAAFLTARMMAGSGTKKPELDMVEVPVAVKDIPIGTKLPPKDVEKYFTKKNFPRENVPPSAITTLDEIGDKRAMRTIRQGETVGVADLNAKGFIDPPDGTVLMTTAINLEQSASGFALPGYKVMVIATKKSQKKNMDIVFPLFADALILAVDTSTTAPQAGGQNGQGGQGGQANKDTGATAAGFQSVGMISFAVTPDQSMLLTMAANGGATLRLGLPNQAEDKKQMVIDGYKHMLLTREQIENIFADRWPDEDKSADKGPKFETVKVLVPAELVAKDTQLTQAVLDKKFKTVEFPKELLPEVVAVEEKDLLDQYVTADLVAGLQVPKPHLSKTEPKKPMDNVLPPKADNPQKLVLAGVKAGHSDDAASPKADTDTSPAAPKPKDYVYVLINTPQGKRYQKFEATDAGNVFAGEATEEEYLQYQAGKGGKAPAK